MPDDKIVTILPSLPVEIIEVGDDPGMPLPLSGDGLLHPWAITLLYGQPNVGKGMLALHILRALMVENARPLVLDFEHNIWEWRQRAFAMGIRFPVYVPIDQLTKHEVIRISNAIAERRITHCILDSASRGKTRSREGDFGASESTIEFMDSVRRFGVPTLVLAHEGKSSNGPLGSTHWVSVPRLVLHAVQKKLGTVDVYCEKYSDGDKTKVGGSFVIFPSGHSIDIRRDYKEATGIVPKVPTVQERILAVMLAGIDYSITDIMERVNSDGGKVVSENHLRVTITRMREGGTIAQVRRGFYSKVE